MILANLYKNISVFLYKLDQIYLTLQIISCFDFLVYNVSRYMHVQIHTAKSTYTNWKRKKNLRTKRKVKTTYNSKWMEYMILFHLYDDIELCPFLVRRYIYAWGYKYDSVFLGNENLCGFRLDIIDGSDQHYWICGRITAGLSGPIREVVVLVLMQVLAGTSTSITCAMSTVYTFHVYSSIIIYMATNWRRPMRMDGQINI